MGLREVYAADLDAAKRGVPFSPVAGVTVWLRPDWAPEFERLHIEQITKYPELQGKPWFEWPEHVRRDMELDRVAVAVIGWDGESLPCTRENVRAAAEEIPPFRIAIVGELARRRQERSDRAADLGNASPPRSNATSDSPTGKRSPRRSSNKASPSPTS